MKILKEDFVLSRIEKCDVISSLWNIKYSSKDYSVVDLRMCNLESLKEQFIVLFDRTNVNTSLTSTAKHGHQLSLPKAETVLSLDLSLNQLISLKYSDLSIFHELRDLNASFNSITDFPGITVCSQLTCLNLSYNDIEAFPTESLEQCQFLTVLNLSSNRIREISSMPVLGSLRRLNLGYNEIASVHGIHVLANLTYLQLQRNKLKGIVGMSACMGLRHANLSHNEMENSKEIVEVLSHLHQLVELDLEGNILSTDIATLVQENTSVAVLDGRSIRSIRNTFQPSKEPPSVDPLKTQLKQDVHESMQENTKREAAAYSVKLHHLHTKTKALLDELENLKARNDANTELWCSYIDGLTESEAKALSITNLKELTMKREILEGTMLRKQKKSRTTGPGRPLDTSSLLVQAADILSKSTQ